MIKEIYVKSIINKSNLPESDYCINPYIGCLHACVYCYGRFMRRFTGHTGEKWGTFLDAKINAPDVLEKQLQKVVPKGVVLLGSVTDAYQPVEKKYNLTRRILEALLKYQMSISILTKSSLVCRDIDLFKQFEECSVGLTITTLNDQYKKIIEPYSSSVNERLETLKELSHNKINTYVFIGPIIPFLTPINEIILKVKDITDSIWCEALNIKCGNRDDLKTALDKIDTNLYQKVINKAKEPAFWNTTEIQARKICNNLGLPFVGFYRH